MGKYYLFSDFSEKNGFSLIRDEFKKDLKNYNKIVFIASNPDVGEITDKYAEIYLKWFERIRINFKNKVILDSRIAPNEMINEVNSASLIYLMGGTTPLQMKFLADNRLIEPLQNSDALIMGLSAGAINMAKTSILTKRCGHEIQEVYSGIGLVDKTVEPHFILENYNFELKELSFKYSIYGMYDESAIIIRNDEYYYHGNIYKLKEGRFEKIN